MAYHGLSVFVARFTGEVDRQVVGLLTEYCGFEASQLCADAKRSKMSQDEMIS